MFGLMKRAFGDLRRFQGLPENERTFVFYSEDAASWVHFEPVVRELSRDLDQKVCYVTSDAHDPIFKMTETNILPFYVGSGFFRTLFFSGLEAKIVVMTMPDLESFHIKRSKKADVHYVYLFHSMVSTHMIYRKHAFDHFDTIFCVGPHHEKEIRAWERSLGLSPKRLIQHGYGRLDSLLQETEDVAPTPGTVVVAPSWGENGLLESAGDDLVEVLATTDFQVVVRPHPMTVKKWDGFTAFRSRVEKIPNCRIETDVRSSDSFRKADVMISDWSGAALEFGFAYKKPVVFVDTPRKVNNPDYEKVKEEPVEVTLRDQIGTVVKKEDLRGLASAIESASKKRIDFDSVRERTVFHIGQSGRVGAQALVNLSKGLNS